MFLDRRTPAVNIRRFVRQHGLELQLPAYAGERQLATSTSELVTLVNEHGRLISISFTNGKVKKSDGKIAQVQQVIRGLDAVLIVGDGGVYRLTKPTGTPHLLLPIDPTGNSG